METTLIAKAEINIKAPRSKVWDAFTNPVMIKKYMFGTNVVSDWKEGSQILWNGEWKGKAYEDKGVILKMDPGKLLQYSHFSPMMGKSDAPENYHTVTVELIEDGSQTRVTLTQDNSETEQERQHSEENWKMMLESMKKLIEG